MKKYKSILASMLLSLSIVGCTDFLDVTDYSSTNTTNFPESQADVDQLITGLYASTHYGTTIKSSAYLVGEMASDDRFGSGSNLYGIDKLMVSTGDEEFWDNWDRCYEGIYRANFIIENIDRADGTWDSEDIKNTYLGEAYGHRAFFYWELAQLFGTTPLTLKTEAENLPKADPDDYYASIASDLIEAIDLLPNSVYSTYEGGRFSRWAAIGYLARVYLFYVGIYQNNDLDAGMPLRDGSTLSKSDVLSYLTDCINNSGHGLVDEYLDLYPYTNSYTKPNNTKLLEMEEKTGYTYNWAGEGNKEVMHAQKYGTLGSSSAYYRNYFVCYQSFPSVADKKDIYPFGQSFGHGSANPQIAEDWDAEMEKTGEFDIRKFASLIDCNEGEDREINVPYSECVHSSQAENSPWHAKKNCVITAYDGDDVTYSFNVVKYSLADAKTTYIDEFVFMRYADILLMASELSQDVSYMNQIRTRAHLSPIASYSFEALKNERRWELTFEGVRWNDIRRWGIAADLLETQANRPIYVYGALTTMGSYGGGYTARYNATNGFFMIPSSEITISEGVLVQNPGWSGTDNYRFTAY